jgi:peptide/nickel transport system substrate-binding protein
LARRVLCIASAAAVEGMMMHRLLAALLLLALAAPTPAADLVIALASEPSSLDPQFHILTPNEMVAKHVFEPLVIQGDHQQPLPGLAVSWRALDATTWQFDLRHDVRWHDGTPFTAADVLFSLARAPKVPNSPASYNLYLKQVTAVTAPDPFTVMIKTDAAFPLQPVYLSNIMIVQARTAEQAATADFNSGKAMVGTGPYRFVEWVRGDHIAYRRNDDYWGGKEPWENLTLKPITNAAARTAALLSGGVDVIENVPPTDAAMLKTDPRVNLVEGVSNLVMFLNFDHGEAPSPFVTDKTGKALPENPLRKLAVRRAISKAINRDAIVARTMDGAAVPAAQMVANLTFGADPMLKPEPFDPEGARRLLAEAGYPDGFAVTIHGPNNRYVNDAQISQAVAQMLSRIGIATKVETMPLNVFFTRAQNREFSLFLTGWGSGSGEASVPLNAVLHSYSADRGMGAANRGRYANPEFDQLLETAMTTFDDGARERLLQRANALAVEDVALVPLHVQLNRWATRKGLGYLPRTDAMTVAMGVRPN